MHGPGALAASKLKKVLLCMQKIKMADGTGARPLINGVETSQRYLIHC